MLAQLGRVNVHAVQGCGATGGDFLFGVGGVGGWAGDARGKGGFLVADCAVEVVGPFAVYVACFAFDLPGSWAQRDAVLTDVSTYFAVPGWDGKGLPS